MNEKETHECTACCPTCYACIFDMVDQQREWVGLTNEQIVDLVIKNAGFPTKLAKAIEAKLKQKNNIGVND